MNDLNIISSSILMFSPVLASVASFFGFFGLDKSKSDKFCYDVRKIIKQRKHNNLKKIIYIDIKRSDSESVNSQITEVLESFQDVTLFEKKLNKFNSCYNSYNLFLLISILLGFILLISHFVLKHFQKITPEMLKQIFLFFSLSFLVIIIIWFLVLFVKKESIRKKYEQYYGL